MNRRSISVLQAVPAVGINIDFIKTYPLTLTVQGGFMGASDSICFEDGTPFINIERELLSAKHRITFIDARSDQKLFEMVKERSIDKYYAEYPDDGDKRLFDIGIETAFVGGPSVSTQFANVADSGSIAKFDYKVHTFEKNSMVLWDGQLVAAIKRQSLARDFSIQIAPNVDPLPIIAMLMALTDKARKQKKDNAYRGPPGFWTAGVKIAAWQGASLGAA